MMAEYSEEVPRLNVSLAMAESTPPKALDPCNVFVKYLPSALDDAELAKLFGSFGRILSSKIMVDPTSRKSLGFGFVRFSNAAEARSAIDSMDGHKMGTKRLLCKLANSSKEKEHIPVSAGKQSSDDSPKGPRSSSSASAAHSGISGTSSSSSSSVSPASISQGPLSVDRRHSNHYHSTSHGQHHHSHEHTPSYERYPQHSAHSHSHGGYGSSRTGTRGSGSDTLSRASTSPASLSPRAHKSSILNMKQPSTNLYIKSLLSSDTEDTLRELFGRFGEIVACKVMVDKLTGQSRRIGFVRYTTLDQAASAIQAMHGSTRGDGTLSVKYADDERQKEARKRLRQSSAGSQTLPGIPNSLSMHMDPSSSASMLSQGHHMIPQPPYGMLSRHGSLEGRAAFSPRPAPSVNGAPGPVAAPSSAGQFLPIPWAYGWPTPVYTPVYESAHTPWLLVYPPDGYVGAPRAPETIPQYPYPMPSLYFPVDGPNAPDTRPAGEETSLASSAAPRNNPSLSAPKSPQE